MKDLSNLISDLKGTSKPKEKQDILLSYDSDFLKELIKYTYDPFKLFNVVIKPKDIPAPSKMSLNEMENTVRKVLSFCLESKSPKQNREKAVEVLEYLNEGSQELLVGVLNKNWKCGLGTKNVLKVYDKIVPVFEVQLANTFDVEKDYKVNEWLCTPKLDGVRGIALRVDGEWKFYTRKGKEILTVDHIKEELELIYNELGITFWDGELYKHGLEFGEIQGFVSGFTKGTAYDLEYHVFAYGDAEDFLNQEPDKLSIIGVATLMELDKVKPVNANIITNDMIQDALNSAFSDNYEGIMLRPNGCSYDFKRSNQLLKLKSNEDEGETITDCIVEDIIVDKFPVIELGMMIEKKLVTAIVVKQPDGTNCNVGSGFDLEFRSYYKKYPDELIGKVVEIKHQGIGSKGKMRFPRLFRIREDL